MTATAITPRLALTVANDLRSACAKRKDNPTFMVDLYGVRIEANGQVFAMEVKQYWDALEKPGTYPILGTVRKGETEVWSFNNDPRVKAGFKGRVQIVAHQGTTYAVFRTTGLKAVVHCVVPLVDLLTQTTTVMPAAASGRLKQSIAKAINVDTFLTKAEDDAVSYTRVTIDQKDGLRLVKVSHVRDTWDKVYEVVDETGSLKQGPFKTLIEGRLAIGHVPQAPQTAPGGKKKAA